MGSGSSASLSPLDHAAPTCSSGPHPRLGPQGCGRSSSASTLLSLPFVRGPSPRQQTPPPSHHRLVPTQPVRLRSPVHSRQPHGPGAPPDTPGVPRHARHLRGVTGPGTAGYGVSAGYGFPTQPREITTVSFSVGGLAGRPLVASDGPLASSCRGSGCDPSRSSGPLAGPSGHPQTDGAVGGSHQLHVPGPPVPASLPSATHEGRHDCPSCRTRHAGATPPSHARGLDFLDVPDPVVACSQVPLGTLDGCFTSRVGCLAATVAHGIGESGRQRNESSMSTFWSSGLFSAPYTFSTSDSCLSASSQTTMALPINHRLPRWVSAFPHPDAMAVDCRSIDWAAFRSLYLFPPSAMLPQLLHRILECPARLVVVVPWKPHEPWFPPLLQGAVSHLHLRTTPFQQTGSGTVWHSSGISARWTALLFCGRS